MFFVGILVGACLMYYFINKYRLVPVIQAKYISKYGSKVVTVTNVYETSVYYELDGKEYNVPRDDFSKAFVEYNDENKII